MRLKDLLSQTVLKDVEYNPGETFLREYYPITVESTGRGPESTLLPKCKIIVTSERIIIAQKMLWSKSFKVHYFIWLNGSVHAKTIGKGVLHLNFHREDLFDDGKHQIIIPDDSFYITKLSLRKLSKLELGP